MLIMTQDNVLSSPKVYVRDIFDIGFQDVKDGDNVFKNIQFRDKDEFYKKVSFYFPDYYVTYNFVRQSPLNQLEPNFIHTDEMMGDITVVLYLNEESPNEDGTTIYDNQGEPWCKIYSKFNRMVAFESDIPHSRNIFENFGEGEQSRLVQVIFLKLKSNEG